MIGFDIIRMGPYASEAEAIQIAIKVALDAGMKNPAGAVVLVQQPNDALQIVWSSGDVTQPADLPAKDVERGRSRVSLPSYGPVARSPAR